MKPNLSSCTPPGKHSKFTEAVQGDRLPTPHPGGLNPLKGTRSTTVRLAVCVAIVPARTSRLWRGGTVGTATKFKPGPVAGIRPGHSAGPGGPVTSHPAEGCPGRGGPSNHHAPNAPNRCPRGPPRRGRACRAATGGGHFRAVGRGDRRPACKAPRARSATGSRRPGTDAVSARPVSFAAGNPTGQLGPVQAKPAARRRAGSTAKQPCRSVGGGPFVPNRPTQRAWPSPGGGPLPHQDWVRGGGPRPNQNV